MNKENIDRAVDHGIRPLRGEQAFRYCQNLPLEDLPQREGRVAKIALDWDRHHEGLRFWGLQGKIRKGLGRPFDKVYSELCEEIRTSGDFNGKDEAYVRSMIEWYIELHPFHIGNGVYLSHDGRGIYRDFFVHPETGLICATKKSWRQRDWKELGFAHWRKHEVRYVHNCCYWKINKIWYEVILANVPKVTEDWRQDYWKRPDKIAELNLYDWVLRSKLTRWLTTDHTLENVHGIRTYQNKLVPPEKRQWNEFYKMYVRPQGHIIYAKALRQLKEKEIRRLNLGSEQKLPNIVR